jgi:hypothetical protein
MAAHGFMLAWHGLMTHMTNMTHMTHMTRMQATWGGWRPARRSVKWQSTSHFSLIGDCMKTNHAATGPNHTVLGRSVGLG